MATDIGGPAAAAAAAAAGGGGNNSNTNEQEGGLPQSAAIRYEFDNACVKLVALEMVDDIFNAAKLTGYEYGVTLISNGNGTFGAFRDAITTNFSTTSVNFEAPRDGTVVGFVHNHPWQKSTRTDPYINQRSEYPSGPDWEQAEKLVTEGGVSDPTNFSLFIIDVNGIIREFKYSDKAYYQSLSLGDKYAKVGLPAPLTPCTVAP